MFMKIRWLLISLLFFPAFSTVSAQQGRNAAFKTGTDRPKVVVGIVVDQMRWDYLYRYYNKYSEGGFKRLLNHGFSYENTMLPYTPAVTGAGHACLYTGSVPAVHGIVGNEWIERLTGEYMYCAQDKTVQTVGSFSNQGQMSPRNMLTTTIGDELRLATNFKSRVFGIALKDRGSILPAGHSANAAYWFDDSTGNWITSNYYMTSLPQWVQEYNAGKKPDSLMVLPWKLLREEKDYDQSTTDDKPYERLLAGESKPVFPHNFTSRGGKNYLGFRYSPYANTFTLDFAKKLISREKLGAGLQTDMLCISLSPTDYIGHQFGPQSREAEDTYIRLDKDLADFFSMLDNSFGKDEYVLFLSADHGAPHTPDFMKENRLPGGVLSGYTLLGDMNKELSRKFGTDNLLQRYFEYQFVFDRKKLEAAAINESEAHLFLVNSLMKRPEVVNAFSYLQFDKAILPAFLKERFTNGYFPKRSGDVQFILRSQYSDYRATGTDHGSWYPYDSHIPLLFYGWKIKPGKTFRETYMSDVAPTLAAMLRIQMPSGSVGKVLEEVIR